MAMWRCPHCGTPQAETARCWVCRRSSTSCGTCRHFRASVAAKVGYCGLDRQRRPLTGDEIRACWESGPELTEAASARAGREPIPVAVRTSVPRRDFIEVLAGPHPAVAQTEPPADPAMSAIDAEPVPVALTPRWSLWEDAEV